MELAALPACLQPAPFFLLLGCDFSRGKCVRKSRCMSHLQRSKRKKPSPTGQVAKELVLQLCAPQAECRQALLGGAASRLTDFLCSRLSFPADWIPWWSLLLWPGSLMFPFAFWCSLSSGSQSLTSLCPGVFKFESISPRRAANCEAAIAHCLGTRWGSCTVPGAAADNCLCP